MAFQIIWSPIARLDLMDLRDYISLDSPDSARRFIASLLDAVERLVDFPLSGRMVPELWDEQIREIIRRPCRIVYRLNDNTVEIIRVWHSARGTPDID